MRYKVEKDIPVPQDDYSKFPFDQMEVENSFFIEEYTRERMQSIGGAISNYRKNHPDKKFTSKKWEGGIRVWRMK